MEVAFVAVTKHVPPEPAVRVDPETEHEVAVPGVATKVTAPSPDPPEVVKVSGVPKVPLVDETVNEDWLALAKVTVVEVEDIELY